MVLDPEEGLNPDGTIRTGVRRQRVPAEFEPAVLAVMEAFGELSDECAELHLYGSVATGMAQLGTSDVDLVAIGVAERWAREIGAALSTRFATLCRGVEIGPGRPADFSGEDDAAYGNRVFLRHHCVPLAGPDVLRRVEPFHGDARAARGFTETSVGAWKLGAPVPTRGGWPARRYLRRPVSSASTTEPGPQTATGRRAVGQNSTPTVLMTWFGSLPGQRVV